MTAPAERAKVIDPDSVHPDSVHPDSIDLDHAATTRVWPEVTEAMAPFTGDRYGNPSGSHRVARDAVRALDEARERIADIVGCSPGEIIFTSGGTEADNHAITGGMPPRDGIAVCSAVEHHAVLDVVTALKGRVVGVDSQARVDLEELALTLDSIGPEVAVVSVMLANNEVGTINDLDAVARVVSEHSSGQQRVPLHTDAVQAAAWLDLGTHAGVADMISISAHKLGGPKGVGALVVRGDVAIRPLILGGGQERGRRSGTPSVAAIVGFAEAMSIVAERRDGICSTASALRDDLLRGLVSDVEGVSVTVGSADTLPGSAHVCIEGVDSESLLLLLESRGVMASAGSSCSSGAHEPSHVLAAMGVGEASSRGAIRFSLGFDSTRAEIARVLEVMPDVVARAREFS